MFAENVEESHHLSQESTLYHLVIDNDIEGVESLLNQSIDVHIKVKGPLSSIHIAVFKGHVNIVEQLLRHGADPNSRYPVAENSYTGSTLLYRAVAQGNEAVVSLLLEFNADVKAENKDGSTALHIAAERGYLKIVKMLLQKGAKVNFEIKKDIYLEENFYQEQFSESKILRNEMNVDVIDNSNISTFDGVYAPLHLAIKAEHNDIMKLLLESGADIDAIDSRGDTPLSSAVHMCHLETVEYLLNHSPSLKNLSNKISLIYAVTGGKEKHKIIIERLLQYGFNYDSDLEKEDEYLIETALERDYSNVVRNIFESYKDLGDNSEESKKKISGLLITAIEEGSENATAFLLDQGASLDKAFCLSSMYRLEKLNSNFLKLLIVKGLNVQNDQKLLLRAIEGNMDIEVIKILLENKADINKCYKFTDDLWSLQHYSYFPLFRDEFSLSDFKVFPILAAAARGDQALVNLFLEYGADVNLKTDNGVTPLLISVAGGHLEIVEVLLNSGANIESADSDKRTPLFLASECGHENIVKLLLGFGAKFDVRAGKFSCDWTLYHASAGKGHLNVIHVLLEYDTYNLMDAPSRRSKRTPLHLAARNGHTSTVKFLLDHGARINRKDDEGETALLEAAHLGHVETVQVLLEYGFSVRTHNAFENTTPLHRGAQSNNERVVELLLKYGAKPDATKNCGWGSPLTLSAENGNRKIVEMLMKSGANVNFVSEKGETALSLALLNDHIELAELLRANGANFSCDKQRNEALLSCTEKGYMNCIEFLLNDSADVNSMDSEGQTALHLAIGCNRADIVQLLLKFGANINAVEKKMRTPLALSAEKGDLEIVKIFLQSGANIEVTDNSGRTALYISAENGHEDVLKMLLEYDAKTNQRAQNFKSPVTIAAERGHFKIVETLVRKGADVNFSDDNGRTALYFAAGCGHVDTVKLLLEHKAMVNTSTGHGKTPLIIASERGHLNCIDPLLKSRANVHATDSQDRRAVHYAAEFGHHEIVEILLKQCADIKCESRNDVSLLLKCAKKKHLKIVDTLMKFGTEFDLNARPDPDDHLSNSLRKWNIEVFTRALEYCCADVKFLNEKTLCLLFEIVNKAHTSVVRIIASEVSNCKKLAEILVCYLIKIKSASLLSNDDNLVAAAYCDETVISSFENECNNEVSRMKCETVGDSDIFVYGILKEDLNRLASFARNKNISEALASDNFGSKFPLYRDIIRNQFDKGKIRRQLIDHCVEICHSSYYHFKPLPSNIIESVLLYLNNRDLRSLLVSNHHSCSSD